MFTRDEWLEIVTKCDSIEELEDYTGMDGYEAFRQIVLDWIRSARNAAMHPLNAMAEYAAVHTLAASSSRNDDFIDALQTIAEFVLGEQDA